MKDYCCVVVADGSRARLFLVVNAGCGERTLSERPPIGGAAPDRPASRVDVVPVPQAPRHHRLNADRGYAHEVASRIGALVDDRSSDGIVLLVAPAHVLGWLRDVVRRDMPPGMMLQELAREYIELDAAQLAQQLKIAGIGSRNPSC